MLYKVNVKCISDFIGEIKANTLFGAFCHACSLKFNKTDIHEYIEDITFSDLFFGNVLPVGIQNNVTQYNSSEYNRIKRGYSTRTLISRTPDENNNIDILPSSVSDKEFCFFINSDKIFDKTLLKEIIELMFVFGIGKWRNVGKGQFSLINIKEFEKEYTEIMSNKELNKLVALSCFQTTNQNELNNLIEMGYEIRNTRATNGKKQKQQVLLSTGTTFKKLFDTKDVVLVGNHIYDENSNTYIHARTILMGV